MHTAAVSKQTRTIAYMSLYFELIFVPSLSTAESTNRIKKSSEISFCKVMGNKKNHVKELLDSLHLSFIHCQT